MAPLTPGIHLPGVAEGADGAELTPRPEKSQRDGAPVAHVDGEEDEEMFEDEHPEHVAFDMPDGWGRVTLRC